MKKDYESHHVTTRSARKILRFLSDNKARLTPLLILTHNYPDPDTLASSFALQLLAQQFGIESRIVYGGVIGRRENREMVRILKIPVHKLKSSDLRKYENVAMMDTQPAFENNPFPKNRRATIIIDQHESVTKPLADLTIIDTECGATSVILAQTLLQHKMELPVRVATALAYGIISDTMNLYRAGRPDVIQTYLNLLHYCDLKALARIQNPSRSRRFFATLAKGTQNAMVRRGVIVSHLGVVESPDLVAQITDFLLTYKNMRWAFCTGRYKGKLYVSLRAANLLAEAGEVLRDIVISRGDAGGHGPIAGGSMTVGETQDAAVWTDSENSLTERLMKRVRIPSKSQFYLPFR